MKQDYMIKEIIEGNVYGEVEFIGLDFKNRTYDIFTNTDREFKELYLHIAGLPSMRKYNIRVADTAKAGGCYDFDYDIYRPVFTPSGLIGVFYAPCNTTVSLYDAVNSIEQEYAAAFKKLQFKVSKLVDNTKGEMTCKALLRLPNRRAMVVKFSRKSKINFNDKTYCGISCFEGQNLAAAYVTILDGIKRNKKHVFINI